MKFFVLYCLFVVLSNVSGEEIQKSEFEQASASLDFGKLKIWNFKQSFSSGACNLYSALFAIQQVDSLKSEFAQRIREKISRENNEKDYYIHLGNSYYKYTNKELIKLGRSNPNGLFPSNKLILVALGWATLNNFENFISAPVQDPIKSQWEEYQIVDFTLKDTFFQKETKSCDVSNFSSAFSANGEYNCNGTKYKGDFIVSIGIMGKHAVSAYYKNSKWNIYDNQKDDLQELSYITSKSISSVFLIGDFLIAKNKLK